MKKRLPALSGQGTIEASHAGEEGTCPDGHLAGWKTKVRPKESIFRRRSGCRTGGAQGIAAWLAMMEDSVAGLPGLVADCWLPPSAGSP